MIFELGGREGAGAVRRLTAGIVREFTLRGCECSTRGR